MLRTSWGKSLAFILSMGVSLWLVVRFGVPGRIPPTGPGMTSQSAARVMIFALTSFSSMTKPLAAVRVAITENRYPEQLAQLLERQGATVHSCPLLRETPVEDAANARRFMEICESTKVDFIIFYTG